MVKSCKESIVEFNEIQVSEKFYRQKKDQTIAFNEE